MQEFPSGATRDSSDSKPHYSGYFSPSALKAFGAYMLKHETQADGKRRAPGNWKLGITKDAYMDSMWRHFMEVWEKHEKKEDNTEALCALLFNVQEWEPSTDGYNQAYDKILDMDKHILARCDAIYLLGGWEHSKGASQEHEWAKSFGHIILHEPPKGEGS